MTKPQAKRKPGSSNGATQRPATVPWGWFGAGIFLGAFAMFVLLLAGVVNDPRQQAQHPGPAQTGTGKEAGTATSHQQFEFYTRLPENRVDPPQVPEYDPGTTREDIQYILQAASFRRFADADELRARLALLGIETSIQKVENGSAGSWYRVQAGPYLSKREVSVVRKKMQDARLDPLVLQIKD